MFTGIIETVGTIRTISPRANYKLLTIQPDSRFDALELGESIAVDGCCLTVTEIKKDNFTVEASQETIRMTILKAYKEGRRINLERALTPISRLGGHFVSGHVDCRGKISSLRTIGESLEVSVKYPDEYDYFVVEKGSIAINGISLTVNTVKHNILSVNIIPHTMNETTIHKFKIGDEVNLEFDIIGKYAAKILKKINNEQLTIEKLLESGW